MGGRTFGKGLVQQVLELPYKTALKMTIARYYTPSGRCMQVSPLDNVVVVLNSNMLQVWEGQLTRRLLLFYSKRAKP